MVLVGKNPPANSADIRDAGSIPESGRTPGEGNGNPLQYACLENSMNREAWQATVHGVTKSRTQLKQLSTNVYQQIDGSRCGDYMYTVQYYSAIKRMKFCHLQRCGWT